MKDVHGISIAGGKGRKSTETKNEIPKLAEKHYNLSSTKLINCCMLVEWQQK